MSNEGRCGRCLGDLDRDGYYCTECLKIRRHQKKVKKIRGKCTKCGEPRGRGGRYCRKCLDRKLESYYLLKKMARCTNCQKKLDRRGSYCKKCLREKNAYWRSEAGKETLAKWREKRVHKGLCLDCPRIASPGHFYCMLCRNKQRGYKPLKPWAHRRDERLAKIYSIGFIKRGTREFDRDAAREAQDKPNPEEE